MGNTINLRDHPVALDSDVGRDLIVDCARYAEKLLSEKEIRKKYRFDDETWTDLGNNEALIEAVEVEKVRRIRNGDTARERAQQHFATAPDVLGTILHDDSASPRHRIESAKELRTIAATGPDAVPAKDRFVITINLGDRSLKFDKPLAVDAGDTDHNDIIEANPADADAPPRGLLAATTAKKRDDQW